MVATTELAGTKNWTSTEDPFPRLGDVEHCVLDSSGQHSIGPATHADFLPNCPVIAACHLTSWVNETGGGAETELFGGREPLFWHR